MTIHKPSVPNWASFVRKAAEEVDAKFTRRDWTSTYPGHGEYSAKGAYAIDFMISTRSMGDKICAYLVANRKRLGLRYLIWNRRIINWGRDGQNARWKTYFNASSSDPSKNHTNHVHASFEPDGAYVPIKPAGNRFPPATKEIFLDKLEPGVKDSDSVWHLQNLLNAVQEPDIKRDGDYGPATVAAVRQFQLSCGWDEESSRGDVGPATLGLLIAKAGKGYQSYKVERQS